jgi:hypothetical protein
VVVLLSSESDHMGVLMAMVHGVKMVKKEINNKVN